MASNQPACAPAPQAPEAGEWDEWNPTTESSADSAAADRGKHRLPKQRSIARGSTVLSVAAVAAIGGATGIATAADKSPVPISLPDLPKLSEMPGIGDLMGADGASGRSGASAPSDFSHQSSGMTTNSVAAGAGEALRARILDHVAQVRDAADRAARDAAAGEAAATGAKEAAAQKVRDAAAAAKAEAAAKKKAAEDATAKAAAQAEAERLAKLAASYTKPVASYSLTASFGQSSSLWANTHTGQDFAAPTGTPVSAIHSGTITSAAWAGSYGYRIILTLDDGTEIWYCHLSSMVQTSGKVTTGETIGRVGATGNVTGPHLHIEVRPGGGGPIDPMPWLRDHGIDV
ncbi:M23 family metallopeptidase [Streptomyces sp. H10-C2]|uniref:M23 family metallopeptidase n=1 Tax=unclassified Streptomyces TaxID=2593676 RepID=UPI0024BA35F7|nr:MULTISPECIES: M23 family metallopeptidase [unclassified Streptomyces]MDJ0344964.1 M23 family metallopeptidase [Streptomyces sp. PH10-H1]MDJ0373955.1 M23 family metallopeptidase [Streptomyces sp. H10-C2]